MILEAEGFILRPFKLSDKQSLARHANNKKISDCLRDRFPHPYTEEDAAWFINFVLTNKDPVTNFVIDKNGEAIGCISFFLGEDVYKLNAEIGYWLGEDYWGKGMMTDAIKAVVRYIFERFDIKRIFALPFSTTIGSIRALEKAGFHKEATIKDGVIKNGKILDYHIFSILSSKAQ